MIKPRNNYKETNIARYFRRLEQQREHYTATSIDQGKRSRMKMFGFSLLETELIINK